METYTQKVNREDEVKHKILNILQAHNRTSPHQFTVSFGDGVKFYGLTESHWFSDVDKAYIFALINLRG